MKLIRKNSILTSQKTHHFSTTNSNLFTLFKELIALCRNNRETNKQTTEWAIGTSHGNIHIFKTRVRKV